MADTLFDAAPYVVELPPPEPKLSQQRRQTIRQAQAVANGVHPLGLALRYPIRMHPDAPRVRTGPGPRCGTCWYRQVIETNGNRRWPKCMYGVDNPTDDHPLAELPRVSHGPGTDVRRWWPACIDYSPGDPGLSPDAARHVPEEVSHA